MIRERGYYGEVEVYWELFDNGTNAAVPPGQDFEQTTGNVTFDDLQQTAALTLTPISDGIPEFAEHFKIQLYNVTGKCGDT